MHKEEGEVDEAHGVRSWIQPQGMVIIPNDGYGVERKGAQMALMCYSCNKLHHKKGMRHPVMS